MNQELRGLYQQKQILEAQMNAYHFAFPILEANRLLIRINSTAEDAAHFWNSNRGVLNSQMRTHMALVAEYQIILRRLDRLNKVYATAQSLIQNSPNSEL